MNPRYPQPQGAPVDGMTKQLQMLSALKGLGGHQQIEQQQLQQNDDASRMTAALHLLGLQQQGDEQQGMQDFRGKQLQLEGQRNQSEDTFRQNQLGEEKNYHQNAIGSQMVGDMSRLPGMDINHLMQIAGVTDPRFAQLAQDQQGAARAQAIERVYPMLKLVTDPVARETVGRAQLSQYPGAYEEALAKAYPQASVGGAPPSMTQAPNDLQGVLAQAQGAQANQQAQQQQRAQQQQQQGQHQNIIDYINSVLPPKSVIPDPSGGTHLVAPAGGRTFIPATSY